MNTKKEEIVSRYNSSGLMSLSDLREITELLRAEDGCPWDREQTHESIRNNFIEETYEAVEAIDNGDKELLKEELGDVLLQVLFHARIEEETGGFSIDDVADGICRKLVLRHPHVFGDVSAETSGEVLKNWDAIKQKSKNQKKTSETVDSVAKSLPALMRAQKELERAYKGGFLGAALRTCDGTIGGRLLSVVADARVEGVNAEEELSKACDAIVAKVRKAEE